MAVLLMLAGNAATSAQSFPGWLDELRQDPWPWVAGLGALSVLAAGVAVWMQEHPPAYRDDPPPPQPAAVPGWFVDRAQSRAAVVAVCRGGRAVGITTSLWGSGGFGKTTLATAVAARRRVRRRFRSRIYTVTVGRDVRGPAAVAAKVVEVTKFITGDTTEFDDPDLAGAHLGRLLDQRPRTLLVLDDVWEDEQLAPFLHGGRRCVRLVTTRNPDLLPPGAQRIPVDQMSSAQAKAVLTWDVPPLPDALTDGLLQATGHWALLLRLTNRLIAEQAAAGADSAATAERLLHRLRAHGPSAVDNPAAWNLNDPRMRNKAVKASIEAATTLLPSGGPYRFTELGVFAEDESIPVSVVALLWQATGGLTEDQTRSLCLDLHRLSLVTLEPRHGGRISLHDVFGDYLRGELGTTGLVRLNGILIDAVAATLPPAQPLTPTAPNPARAWWQLTDGYLLDHLIDHLLAAGRTTSAEAVGGDVRWVEARLAQRGPSAPWSDLTRIDTPHSLPLARSLAQTAHLLTPTDPPHALTGILHSRLDAHPHWHTQIRARQQDPALRPCLANRWPLPDSPNPALQRTLTGHIGPVRSVAIAQDGSWLATGGADKTVRIWDRASGTCTTTLTGHTATVQSVAISPDGTWLATGSADKTVRIWDRASGTCTTTLTGHTATVRSVAIAQDGTWLATGSADKTVRIWDRASGTCTTTPAAHIGWVGSMAIAPDGTWLATSGNRAVRIWDRASGTCTTTLTGHTATVQSVAISPDGTWLATAGDDKTVRIWDRASGTCTTTLNGRVGSTHQPRARGRRRRARRTPDAAHTGPALSVAIAPDGSWLATTSSDGTVRIWDRASGTFATLTGHTGSVPSVAISPDGTWLATAGDDSTVRIWDHVLAVQTLPGAGPTGSVLSVAISPDGTWLATTSGTDRKVWIWDQVSGTCTNTLPGHGPGAGGLVVIAPDGSWLATTTDRTVRIWDRASGTLPTFLAGQTASVLSVAISPDGTWLATTSDRTVRIWDRATGTCTATLTGHTATVQSVAISPDGTWLATAGNDKTARIWDRASGTCTTTLNGHTEQVRSVAIAPDGTWLATTGTDRTVRIWDRATGTCTATLTGHTASVQSVAISRDGTWLATAGDDMTARIWSVAGHRTVALIRTEGALNSCSWGAFDHQLAVGGEKGVHLLALLT
ncbi:NB-ARC domain-containing protein [Streptomyces sp. NPDC002187]|uniref:NB-ARC domain-containing protein n=1 Tax=Streptomyces sp. NPDC002187 TaxID=3364637 RepID=UPI0036A76295